MLEFILGRSVGTIPKCPWCKKKVDNEAMERGREVVCSPCYFQALGDGAAWERLLDAFPKEFRRYFRRMANGQALVSDTLTFAEESQRTALANMASVAVLTKASMDTSAVGAKAKANQAHALELRMAALELMKSENES